MLLAAGAKLPLPRFVCSLQPPIAHIQGVLVSEGRSVFALQACCYAVQEITLPMFSLNVTGELSIEGDAISERRLHAWNSKDDFLLGSGISQLMPTMR